jgi:hypothetical protein
MTRRGAYHHEDTGDEGVLPLPLRGGPRREGHEPGHELHGGLLIMWHTAGGWTGGDIRIYLPQRHSINPTYPFSI